MKTTAVIAEYNPFHTGHMYQLQEARRLSDADFIVVLMSGDFVQRGAPAVMEKRLRARAALMNGADLVLELPVCWSTGSAQDFAAGAVSLLAKSQVIDVLSFGCECSSLQPISALARLFLDEPEEYKTHLRENLAAGLSFPEARSKAAAAYLGSDQYAGLLKKPNTILGIEYCKAVQLFHSSMELLPVPRRGAEEREQTLNGEYASASAVRNAILDSAANDADSDWLSYMPENMHDEITGTYRQSWPSSFDDYSLLLFSKLLDATEEDLSCIYDIPPQLASRITHMRNSFRTCSDFAGSIKAKNYTYTRVSRAMTHLLLDITDESIADFKNAGYTEYARILGFREEALPLLSAIKKKNGIKLLPKPLRDESLSPVFRRMLAQDIQASQLYQAVLSQKYSLPFRDEYTRQLITIE